MKSSKLIVIFFLALAIPPQLLAQQTRYIVKDLGTFGGTFSWAFALNNRGQVVGFSSLPDGSRHAFLWQAGVMIDLGTLGGPNSTAFAINERGAITGVAETLTPDPLAEEFCSPAHLTCVPFVWGHGVMNPLPTLGGNNGGGHGINARGQVSGRAETDHRDPTCLPPQVLQYRPVIWTDGEAHELPTIPGDPDGWPAVINARGQVVGVSTDCKFSAFHAVLWEEGTVKDLGNLGAESSNVARSVNDRGQVVGQSGVSDATGAFHAFFWQDGMMRDLGTLPGDFLSNAWSINNKGQVTGISCDVTGSICRAFLWENGIMSDLNDLIASESPLVLINASQINARGQIAGLALEMSSGELHPFLATPRHSEVTSEVATNAVRGPRPSVVLPANVRKMLRENLAKPYVRGGLGGWNLMR
jgi:probable HAF family extracellular repeat protein